MNLDFFGGRCFVLPNSLLAGSDFEGTGRKTKKVIPVGQVPAILGAFAGVFPFDLPFGRNDADLVAVVITT
jgi:hypothetical protein